MAFDLAVFRESFASVQVVIRGQTVVARPLSVVEQARLSEGHRPPGVPTIPDASGNPEPVPGDPKYLAAKERHQHERACLEAAAMLGFTTSHGLSLSRVTEIQQVLDWVKQTLAEFAPCFTQDEVYGVVIAVRKAGREAGAAAKNSFSSSPKGLGSTAEPEVVGG